MALEAKAPTADIPFRTVLELSIACIKRFSPEQLCEPPRSCTQGTTVPLEDQYQKETYRHLLTLLDGGVRVSPEFIVGEGKGGGTIDFFIASHKWGIEIARGNGTILEHMRRFWEGGKYYSLLEARKLEKYVVLNFTFSYPVIERPGNSHRLSKSSF